MLANKIMTDDYHFVSLKAPIADFAVAGTGVTFTGVNMSDYLAATFFLLWGVGATGTNVVTVNAATDASNTSPTAIPFRYRSWGQGNTTAAFDTAGAWALATTAGFTTTAGSQQAYAIEVNAQDMSHSGKKYAVLKLVAGVNSALLGCAFALLLKRTPRAGNLDATVVT